MSDAHTDGPVVGPPGPLDDVAVVVPSVGRASLRALLDSLAALDPGSPRPAEVVVVDDRRDPRPPLAVRGDGVPVRVALSGGRGPAAARNVGWRATTAAWVSFLDDDVLVPAGWSTALAADLDACGPGDGATTGRIVVPLPTDRRPTDWERNTAGLATAVWATADMAYRRAALEAVGGFDERFPRAYREDADLAVRVSRAGWAIRSGRRSITHPVRPADDRVSIRVQAGNADDALLRALYGRRWRTVARTGPGRGGWHAVTVASAAVAVGAGLARRPGVAGVAALGWAGLTADFARRRIAPGPARGEAGRDEEVRRMVLTSAAIPPVATWHRARGTWRWRRGVVPWGPADVAADVAGVPTDVAGLPVQAVLFDRDGTLVHDVPYNGNPDLVRPIDGAVAAVGRVRAAGLATGVVSNQSGIARGLLTRDSVDAVNARVDQLFGGFGTWQVCPHGPDDGCDCRKPAPGMVLAAAAALGVDPARCVVIGDIGADVGAATAAGARSVLVPTPVTRAGEVHDAPVTAVDLGGAVDLVLHGGLR